MRDDNHTPQELEALAWRGIAPGDECNWCLGSGKRTYPSTATWKGGIGGQALTDDVCDNCWGSGEEKRPWPSHKRAWTMAFRIRHLVKAGDALSLKLENLKLRAKDKGPFSQEVDAQISWEEAAKAAKEEMGDE